MTTKVWQEQVNLYSLEDKNMFDKIIDLIDKTSRSREIIETCGHAMYIGRKK